MKTVKMLTILVLILASMAHGSIDLTVNGKEVDSIILKPGQSCTIEVVSDDNSSYLAYVGFDNANVLGTFSHLSTEPNAGNLAAVSEYNQPAFYGYEVLADAIYPDEPSPGVHFIFEYEAQQLGETDVKLYENSPPPSTGPLRDNVHITVISGAMSMAFTYQGRLMDANRPADGLYDFQFKLYDTPDAILGTQEGNTINVNELDVIDGEFTVELDFGSDVFAGDARWLEIGVRAGELEDPNVYTTLSPRVELTPMPYAIYAQRAEDANTVDGYNAGNASGQVAVSNGTVCSNLNADYLDGSHASAFAPAPHTHDGRYYTESESDSIFVDVTGDSMSGHTSDAVLSVTNSHSIGQAIRGVASYSSTTNSTVNYGGYFEAGAYRGRAVYAKVTGLNACAVWAENTGSSHGTGVRAIVGGWGANAIYGESTNEAEDMTNYGGFFRAAGEDGEGVRGEATNSGNGFNRGGLFTAAGKYGRGVEAYAYGSDGIGVQGSGKAYDFYAYGPGEDYGSASSIRWKRDIGPINDPLGKVLRLRGVYFNWDAEHGGGRDVGMIAEEVGEVLPEIVDYEEDGIYTSGMDYGKLTPLLVEAVKALKMEVNELQKQHAEKDTELGTQQRQIEDLQKEVAQLKDLVKKVVEWK